MSYVFRIEIAGMSDEELRCLRGIGCAIRVSSAELSDRQYTELQWLLQFKERLELEEPRTFNEKIQWLKLNYRRRVMPALVDKLAVREYVAGKIGLEYLNTLYASAATLRDIDPDALPGSFMVKCTHGSGWNVPVADKSAIRWSALVEKVDRWLEINYYDLRREWVYRDIEPRVIVERLLGPSPGPLDYKVFCFNGCARYVQVDFDRYSNHTRALYDREWRRLPCELRYPAASRALAAPPNHQEMLELAEALAADFPFIRVDFFNERGKIVFGELTFFPGNGFEPFRPAEYDETFGAELRLPEERLEDTAMREAGRGVGE